MPSSGFNLFLANTLYGHDSVHPGDTWDQIDGTTKVFWVPYGAVSNCEGVFTTWTKYIVKAGGCPGGFSCVAHFDRVCGVTTGHCDYLKAVVTLNSDHVRNFATEPLGLPRHIINHETGHVLGLDDPIAPDPVTQASSAVISPISCREWFFGVLVTVQSVMHSNYYCADYGAVNHPWPLVFDRNNVIAISNQDPN